MAKKTLELVFKNASDKEVTLSLADPKDGLTLAAANAAMQQIIDKNIFTSTGGDLVAIADAQIRVLDVIELA